VLGSVTDRNNGLFSFPMHPDRLWGQGSLRMTEAVSPALEPSGHETDHSSSSRAEV